MILLDTDICLAMLKGNRKLVEGYANTSEPVCVSSITAQELFYAANTSSNPANNRILVEKFLLSVQIIHPDLEVLKFAAEVQTKLIKKAGRVSYPDILLYSISKVHNATLITAEVARYCFT